MSFQADCRLRETWGEGAGARGGRLAFWGLTFSLAPLGRPFLFRNGAQAGGQLSLRPQMGVGGGAGVRWPFLRLGRGGMFLSSGWHGREG